MVAPWSKAGSTKDLKIVICTNFKLTGFLSYLSHTKEIACRVSAMEVHNDRGTLEEASLYIRDIIQWTNRRQWCLS